MGVAFCLTAFWGLPFILRVQYTAHFRWRQLGDYSLLLPNEIRPYLLLTLVGLVVAVARGERRVLLFAWPAAAVAFVFVALIRVAPEAALWNARMLPFLYLFSLLVAAYGASVVAGWAAGWLQRWTGVSLRYAWLAVVAVMVVAPVVGAWRHRGFVPDWARYNYTGFEVKEGWPEARALFDTLDTLPQGRVMWEFNRDYERFGTTRTLENMPVFGGQPTMEGLLIESSINAPFHFINQAETSETQTQAVPGIDYPDQMDFPTGLAHLRLYGVRYYVAYDACKDPQEKWVPCAELGQQDKELQAATAAGLPVVKRSGRFTIFEVGTGNLVEVPRYRPVLVDHPDWRANGLTWYANPDWLETPLVFASSDDRAATAAFARLGPAAAHHPAPGAAGAAGRAGRHDQPDRRRGQLPDRPGRRAPHRQGVLVPQLEGGGGAGPVAAVARADGGRPDPGRGAPQLRRHPGRACRQGAHGGRGRGPADPDGARTGAGQTAQGSLISTSRSGMVLRCPGRRPPGRPPTPRPCSPDERKAIPAP